MLAGVTKACSACEGDKPITDFPPDGRRKDGRGSKCRPCADAVSAAYYAKYPAAEAKRRLSNSKYGKEWHQRNRAVRTVKTKWNRILRVYGLTQSDYDRLLAAQSSACAICHSLTPGRKDGHFCIDHNHRNGDVRGLLCQRCNSGVGFFSDDPERMEEAARYVRSREH